MPRTSWRAVPIAYHLSRVSLKPEKLKNHWSQYSDVEYTPKCLTHARHKYEDCKGSYPEKADIHSDDWVDIWSLQLPKLSTSILKSQRWN